MSDIMYTIGKAALVTPIILLFVFLFFRIVVSGVLYISHVLISELAVKFPAVFGWAPKIFPTFLLRLMYLDTSRSDLSFLEGRVEHAKHILRGAGKSLSQQTEAEINAHAFRSDTAEDQTFGVEESYLRRILGEMEAAGSTSPLVDKIRNRLAVMAAGEPDTVEQIIANAVARLELRRILKKGEFA